MPDQIRPTDENARASDHSGPELSYQPHDPRSYQPGIGLIGCGGISAEHLTAYREAGYRVKSLCDLNLQRARKRQQEFFPEAEITQDYRQLLQRDDIQVVDIATHPPERLPIMEASIRAGKHVLSQKPFVLDLDEGRRLVDLADQHNVRLAVNQNGRWAPHFSYIRHAIRRGLIGQVSAAHLAVHWDHTWVAGTEFENVKHLILYDFAIHWFDILLCFFAPKRPERVYASLSRSPSQSIRPALLGQALIEFEEAQASLAFDGDTHYGPLDATYVVGAQGTISSVGPDLNTQEVTVHTSLGVVQPRLEGCWFPDGFHGTMGELLCAIEENRQPTNSAVSNLDSLALCFAAVASSERQQPVRPGDVRRMP